ncbi:MAG TPA: cation:proton antiporter, partial [Actinopolymorphaceae bacterium]
MSDDLLSGILLLTIVAVVSGLARRFGVLRPILLLVVGIGLSYVGGPLDVRLDPEVFLHVLLPLLIFCAARESSLPALRTNLRPVLWLAVGHVVFITLLVGWTVHAVAPAVSLPVAFALGAVVSPPDAIAATSVARRVGLSRRTVNILEGESLLNDATALVLLRVTVAVIAGEAVSLAEVGFELVYAAVSGVLVGAVLGWAVAWLHERIEDPLLNNTLSILTPFLVFLPAEAVDSSGVVAVVVAALYIGHRRSSGISAASRLQMDSF